MEQEQNQEQVSLEGASPQDMGSEVHPPQEKMLSQFEVNKIVERTKQAERRKAEEEFNQRMQNMNGGSNISQEQQDALYQQFAERAQAEAHERARQEHIQDVVHNFNAKLSEGRNLYSDFDSVVSPEELSAFPHAIALASKHDGGPDIFYEFANNPTKLAEIDNLAQRSPAMAVRAMSKIADSIKQNRQAQQDAEQNKVNAPLDRIQPSHATGSNGKPSISDLRAQPWLRG